MTSAYHCGNCPNNDCAINHDHVDNDGFQLVVDSPKIFAQREQVRLRGCLSHPLAQAALREEGAKQERERVLSRLDHEIAVREQDMNRKGNLEDNLTTASGYAAAAGALNWVRVVLIESLRGHEGWQR